MTFDAETIYTQLQPHFKERVRRNEPMSRHCTFGVGTMSSDSRRFQEYFRKLYECTTRK